MHAPSIFFVAVAALARFALATPPACLIAALGAQTNPADIPSLCGKLQDQFYGNITEKCDGSNEAAAISIYSASCLAAGVTITLPTSTSAAATAPTATSTGSASGSKSGPSNSQASSSQATVAATAAKTGTASAASSTPTNAAAGSSSTQSSAPATITSGAVSNVSGIAFAAVAIITATVLAAL